MRGTKPGKAAKDRNRRDARQRAANIDKEACAQWLAKFSESEDIPGESI
jgi:hypothetical protein